MSRPHTRTAFGSPASRRGAPPGSGLTSSDQKRYHWSRSSRGKHENKRADILSEETPVIETQGGSQRGRERRGPPRRANRPQGQKEEGSPGGKRVGQLMRAAAPSPRAPTAAKFRSARLEARFPPAPLPFSPEFAPICLPSPQHGPGQGRRVSHCQVQWLIPFSFYGARHQQAT